MEDIDDVLVQNILDVTGEAIELGLNSAEALERDRAVLLLIDGRVGTHCPILQEGYETTAGVDDDGLAGGNLRGFDVGEHFLVVGTDDGGLAVLGLDSGHAPVKVDNHGIGGGQGQGGLSHAGGTVENHGELLVGEGHVDGLLNHLWYSFRCEPFW